MAYCRLTLQKLLLAERTTENINELVKINEGLLFSQLKKFGLWHDDEAVSLGYEALFIAIKTFDTTKKIAFSTYATVCVYNKLGCYVRSIKARPQLVSYDEAEYTHFDTIDFLEQSDIKYVYKLIKVLMADIKHPTHIRILNIWIASEFLKSGTAISKELQCSQPYVSRVINSFRKNLKNKLEA